MELPHVLAVAKLRAAIAQRRLEEQTLRAVATTSESESARRLAGLDLRKITEQIDADLEEIKRFEAE